MIKVPTVIKIFLLNFVAGITATIVSCISGLLVFGLGRPIFTLSPIKEPLDLPGPPPSHPIEWQAIGILIFVLYFCLIIFVNKSFISDSPYKFEYRFVAIMGFTMGFLLFFGFVT